MDGTLWQQQQQQASPYANVTPLNITGDGQPLLFSYARPDDLEEARREGLQVRVSACGMRIYASMPSSPLTHAWSCFQKVGQSSQWRHSHSSGLMPASLPTPRIAHHPPCFRAVRPDATLSLSLPYLNAQRLKCLMSSSWHHTHTPLPHLNAHMLKCQPA